MAKQYHISEEKLKAILLRNSERMKLSNNGQESIKRILTNGDISTLLNELNVYQVELEMQSNELQTSYETLDAERGKFADLYDFAPIGYFIIDHLGMIEEVNQTGINLLGFSGPILRNKRFQSFICHQHLEKFYSFLNRMQNSNEKINTEVKLILANQQVLYVRMEGIVIPSFSSSNIKYYITVIDITESRNAQQLLQETKERLEMTLKASSMGFWSIENGSDQIVLDEYSHDILDLDPLKFNGTLKSFFLLIHPDDQSKVRYSYMYSLNNLTEMDLEFRILTQSGTIKDIATKGQQIVVSEDHKFFAGIIMDITERKKLLREAEDLKLEQQRAVLSATLDAQENERFKISRALHDSICQILYGIRLNLQSLRHYKNHTRDFENVDQLLDQAIRETREISYELTPSVLKDFGFCAGIKEMTIRLSTPEFLIKTSISKNIDKIHPTIQLYAFRIIQELINNCIKHAHATLAEITVRLKNDSITIVVFDNGEGFKTDLTHALRHGSGLRGIKNQVFLLNGNIDFETTSKGTTITITFNKDIHLAV
ncbi:PAS domain-containing sensor histidine kinase [Albibacterium bauzanense]|uniref:histidine kinase n=1 Tax=Albibacterium bauzanense TaxID=653929 RepID=A0A4R1M1S5_9SPHI|nr:PAS domain-containing protein [Albibacterium bauzanense]TCK83583.1 PAS domain S-box-containing protein [Albibacterium bauzanense]